MPHSAVERATEGCQSWRFNTYLVSISVGSDVEASTFDIGSSSVRLVRVGKVVQAYFSSSLQAKFWYYETSRRFKSLQDSLKGDDDEAR